MQVGELATSSSAYPLPDGRPVIHMVIFLLFVLLAFSLFNVPRALVYMANNGSEISQGYLLRSATQTRVYRSLSVTNFQSKEKPAAELEPRHFPMHRSLRHSAISFMQYRFPGNYTVMQVLLMAGYFAAMCYAAFYKLNPFSNSIRVGLVVVSQIPFVYAFATKNNVIGLLVGVGYEKVRVYNLTQACSTNNSSSSTIFIVMSDA